MMKKIIIGTLIAALAAVCCTAAVWAAPNSGTGANFTDENGDGVCDNRGTAGTGANFADENGDGICDNRADTPAQNCSQNRFRRNQ